MKENLYVVLITVALFVGGLFTGVWIQKSKPLPPPPMQAWEEFGRQRPGPDMQPGGPPPDRFGSDHQQMREEMERKMEELKPKLEAFRKSVEAIEKPFQEKFQSLLTDEQKKKFEENRLSHEHRQAGPGGGPQPQAGPGSGPMPPPPHGAGNPMMEVILVGPTLEKMTQDFSLDSRQAAKLKELLIERRTQFLKLIDANPPPTIKLGQFARKQFQGSRGGPEPQQDPGPGGPPR